MPHGARHGGNVVVEPVAPVKSADAPWTPTWSHMTGMIRVIGAMWPVLLASQVEEPIEEIGEIAEKCQSHEERDESAKARMVSLPQDGGDDEAREEMAHIGEPCQVVPRRMSFARKSHRCSVTVVAGRRR